MADARINETKFIYLHEMWGEASDEWFGDIVGVVIYSNAFPVNGVQIMMVPR